MIKNIITIIILYAIHAANVIADDIEIYQAGDANTRPNIMFLLDTSGSMEETSEFAKGPYDPDVLYPGPFHTDRLYYREFSILGDWFNLDLDDAVFRSAMLNRYVHQDALRCQAHKADLFQFGKMKAKFIQWDPNQEHKTRNTIFHSWVNRKGVWKELQTTLDTNRYVDCEADMDINHGLQNNDNLYMTNLLNSTPYGSNRGDAVPNTDRIWWGGTSPSIFSLDRAYWLCLLGICAGSTDSLYTGNYLNYDYYTGSDEVTEASRMYIMGAVIAEAVGTHAGLNVGLARFDGTALGTISFEFDGNPFTSPIQLHAPDGGMIRIPMRASEGAGTLFNSTIKDWDAWGKTPMSESYFEVSRYMRGEAATFGDDTRAFSRRSNSYMDMPSVPDSKQGNVAGNNYQSPITESCQQNHIIVFSDGQPTYDTAANADIKSLVSSSSVPIPLALNNDCNVQGPNQANDWLSLSRGHGQCADDLSHFLANNDQVDDSRLIGDQFIRTHTIGGFLTTDTEGETADKILESMAEYGKGSYHRINDINTFRKALSDIFRNIIENPVSFTAPVVSVNAFNSLELSDQLYYSVFKPNNALNWAGNIKKYRLGTTADGKIAVLDASNPPINAIDPSTTYFANNTKSFWSAEPDGPSVTQGGLASHMQLTRKILTSTASSPELVPLSTSINKTQLNIVGKDADYHRDLIDWANGHDLKDIDGDGDLVEARVSMEDPLHSVPTIVNYYKDRENNVSKRVMFIGTNSGYLHAIKLDDENPREAFSFIPRELLHNLDKYYSGGELLETKAYGIDGPITHWHQDLNGDGNVDISEGEKVYVYITLRRGGQSIYALDVTDKDDPKLAWQKHGDYPADFPNKPAVSLGYENMGQTWAQLEPATVAWDNEQRVVLFTAGGYDPIEDGSDRNGPASRISHTKGNSIYMIDAKTGEILWDASKHVNSATSDMTSSFAANVAPVDTLGDGLANIVFATDTGGRIWRFDINTPAIQTSLPSDYATDETSFASGGAIADLNGGGGSTNNRRFFNEVDVVYQRAIDKIVLSVGSGYRAHPLTTATQDHHYLIKTPVNKPDAYPTITHNMLSNWGTDNDHGWYVELVTPGEKVLARSATIGNNILITTFAPNDPSTTIACNSDAGQTFLYNLSMTHDSGSISYTLNRQQTNQGGIPPSPVLITPLDYGKDGGSTTDRHASKRKNILIGTEVVTDSSGNTIEVGAPYDNMIKDYWLEKE